MVWQEQIETLVCLLSEADLKADQQANSYWPSDRKEPLRIGQSLEITLQSVKADACAPWGTERIFTVLNLKENTSR